MTSRSAVKKRHRVCFNSVHLWKKKKQVQAVFIFVCMMRPPDVAVRTNTVAVTVMRLLLVKITVFNTMMTIYAVIKW